TSNGRIKFAVSCSSNMNRSMEAHDLLKHSGFNIESYGSGNYVKLPGPSVDKPNIYEFDSIPYQAIREDLIKKDRALYTHNGLLQMLKRNMRVKERPQKFQHCKEEFEVILCLEERVYDQIIDFFHSRIPSSGNLVHVLNIDIRDTQEEASIGAYFVRLLCQKLESLEDLDNQIDDVLLNLDAEHSNRNILHSIHFY
ncbi:UNVERIFIED_CONTAM: RNA polymerase II subunit A C-terminal domain phosphatase SSU72, partial [Eudyptes robustus]